jgi:putative endonuclease
VRAIPVPLASSLDAMRNDPRGRVGQRGEDIAAAHLERKGYRLMNRNYRTRHGEIDLIAARGRTLVFCEVKTLVARDGSGRGPAYPLEAVNHLKRHKVRRLARAWLGENAAVAHGPREMRFDAIGVLLAPSGRLLQLDHLENAF